MREDDTAEAISWRDDKPFTIFMRFHARAYTREKTNNVIPRRKEAWDVVLDDLMHAPLFRVSYPFRAIRATTRLLLTESLSFSSWKLSFQSVTRNL